LSSSGKKGKKISDNEDDDYAEFIFSLLLFYETNVDV